jgi:putative oxidoreductase
MRLDETAALWAPRVLSIVRIVAALIFMEHGTQKLLGFPASPNPGPATMSLSWFAGLIEIVGGALLALGLFTRPVAFILSGEMAVAYFMQHAPNGFWPIMNRGELAALYSFLFLYFAAHGGGAYSLDRLVRGAMPESGPEDGRRRRAMRRARDPDAIGSSAEITAEEPDTAVKSGR